MQLAVVTKDGLLNSLELDVLSWEKLLEREEAWLMLCLVVVAILDLTLEGSELDGLVTSAGVSPVNYGITRLDVEEVKLNRVISINVLVREEEFLSKGEHNGFLNALLTQRLLSVQPVHYRTRININCRSMIR